MKKPNFVIILADDLGYGDLSCYGNTQNRTPNCDALAASGLRLTDFHACAAWCAPSRAGLLSGCHPYRPDVMPWGEKPLPVNSMAEVLRSAGYATAIIGKWHLGMTMGCHPLDQGFDYYYGTPGSNDTPAPAGAIHNLELFRTCGKKTFPIELHRMREMIECPADQELFIQRYTKEATQWISANRDRPFFLYLAHNAPHVPVFPSADFRGSSKAGRFGDVVQEFDWSVGRIVEALEEAGIRDNTMIILTSDNGPWTMFWEFGGTAWPLRGEKATGWEGGTRVPTIISMPGHVTPKVSHEFAVSVDLYATLANMAGAALEHGSSIDSLDLCPMLFAGEALHRRSYLFYAYEQPFSFRTRSHKIHFRSIERMRDPVTCQKSPVTEYDVPLLFDLVDDISEKRDMAHTDAGLVRALTQASKAEAARIAGHAQIRRSR